MASPTDAESGFTRWPWWRRWFGSRAERAAARFLRKKRFRILAANVADRSGELDLIALDGRTLVIVEVRSSESADFENLAASVDAEKQRRITQAALRFLKRRRLRGIAVRFDVLAVVWPADDAAPGIRHYPDAFEAVGRFQMHS